MCLKTNRINASVATKNLVCYKIVKKESLGQVLTQTGSKLELATAYKLVPSCQYNSKIQYLPGNTYTDTSFKDRLVKDWWSGNKEANQGFHSYKNLKEAESDFSLYTTGSVLIECCIPKGAKYFPGSNNGTSQGYCSNKLKVVKILK